MRIARQILKSKLPEQFDSLVRMMPPQAILDDVQYQNTLEMIDRLMASGRLTSGQSLYLETLVELVQSYERSRYAIETRDLSGLASLKYLLAENGMNASDLARVLDVHPSLGSKILKGRRALTVEHLKKLAARFKVSPDLFIDWGGGHRRARSVKARPRRRR